MPFTKAMIKTKIELFLNSLVRREKYFFLTAVVFNLTLIFSGKFFPTMDGPAHLYNSQIINSLISNEGIMDQFFQFNNDLVPNWSGHFLLAFFNFSFPAFIAEKILLSIYLIGLPYAFRILIKTVSPDNYLFSYLIFPFTYSFVFILGFYNFSLAIVLMLFSITFWIKNDPQIHTIKNRLILFSLLTATYFSHLVVFGLTILTISFYLVFKEFSKSFDGEITIKNFIKHLKKIALKGLILFVSSIPALLLSIDYFIKRPTSNNVFTPMDKIWEWVYSIQPIIAYNTPIELVYTSKLFYLLTLTFILAVIFRIVKILRSKSTNINRKTVASSALPNDVWLLTAFVFLMLAFVLPDSNSSAGYVTVRLIFLFFVFLIVWLACQKFPTWYSFAVVISFLYLNSKLNNYYKPVITELNMLAVQCENAAKYIPENSIVAVHSYHDNWLSNHFSNYLGVDKPMVILENYEGATDYFPVQWNLRTLPTLYINGEDLRTEPCFNWLREGKNKHKNVDFLFLFGDSTTDPKTCDSVSFLSIIKNSTLIYSRNHCRLYKLKK